MHKYEWKLGKNYVSFFQLKNGENFTSVLNARNYYVKILKIDINRCVCVSMSAF